MRKIILSGLLVSFIGFVSCDKKETTPSVESTEVETTADSITVTPKEHSTLFPGASLAVTKIDVEPLNQDSVTLKVNYGVEKFALTEHTEDHEEHHLANSADGQHIHFILNNGPYTALYKPEHKEAVVKGSKNYVLSFLSRSYHESLKEPNAFVLKHFEITPDGEYKDLPLPTTPSLFYSRPKGEYKGKDTEKILLDFYLLNADLSANGFKVNADINGKVIVLDKWQPYEITGLPAGENTITLTLIDAQGNVVPGDNAVVTRKITLIP